MEKIAGGSEADLSELQLPDAFVEAVEEKAGVELDLDAADPEAEAPAAEVETPEAEAPAAEVETPEAAAPAAEEAEAPDTPEAETPEVEAEAPEA